MTKEDIKKALEICTDIYAPCNGCPYEMCTNCDNTLHTDALNVIIEQENEIELLQDKCEELRNEKWDAQDDLDCYCDEMPNKIKQTKIDVLNKVKERAVGLAAIETYHICNLIDKLIEEVQNGEDKG